MGTESPSPLARVREWWLALPLGRRLNVMLYSLAGMAMAFLVAAVLAGEGDETGQVAAGGTTTSSPGAATTTVATTTAPPSSTTTTAGEAATSSTPPATRALPSTTERASPTTTSPPGTTSPPQTTSPPRTTAPPTTALVCRNSANPACGEFRWDPPPASNSPLTVTLTTSPANAVAGGEVTFTVQASDPDHPLDHLCGTIDFGDGSAIFSVPCSSPPPCPPHYGPWTPPPAQPGNYGPREITRHTYQAGTFLVTASFTSVRQGLCSALDPYQSVRGVSLSLTIPPSTTSSSSTPPSSGPAG